METFFRERGDVPVAEDFQVRFGEPIAQQFDRGQSEDEVADRAAADDENAIHRNGPRSSIAATGRSVTHHGAGENGCAVDKDQAVGEAPTAIRARAPTNLIAQ